MTKIINYVNINLTFKQDHSQSECFLMDTVILKLLSSLCQPQTFSLFYVFWVYLNVFVLVLSMLWVIAFWYSFFCSINLIDCHLSIPFQDLQPSWLHCVLSFSRVTSLFCVSLGVGGRGVKTGKSLKAYTIGATRMWRQGHCLLCDIIVLCVLTAEKTNPAVRPQAHLVSRNALWPQTAAQLTY